MAYIGKTPTIGNFQKCDAITVVNGQAAYTMQVGGTNVSPESENHMLVSLNGILQAPVDSFTVSGSTITFASNLATGDVIDFIMLLGNVLDLGVPSDNTVSLAKLTATGTKDATTFLRGDNTFASAGGTNTPAFEAYTATSVGVSNNAWSKATFGTERYDTGSAFASSTFTVPSGQAGKYHFYTACRAGNDGANTLDLFQVAFYKNGSLYANNGTPAIIFNASSATINNFGASLSQTMDLSVSDYVEVFVFVRTSVASPDLINDSFFGGYKIIE